ncbi:unnamed protein product [Oikopleura dioica]|uniref:Uncharacterized protein n=1 Tax=Oikopleura dioica TaxID=34765 RepID=E4XNX0_OIKDI|nr:unnamed protein product [Oikopleura dioica]
MFRANEFLAGRNDEAYNPSKRLALLDKYSLARSQRMPVTPEEAKSQMAKNLNDPEIGPDLKRKAVLEQEIEAFAKEEGKLEKELREASLQVLLYNDAVRLQDAGELTDSEEHQGMQKYITDNSLEDVEAAQRKKEKSFQSVTRHLADLRARVSRLNESIKEAAEKNRITTVEKVGDRYFVNQQRTCGLIMPRYLPQEITGNKFFNLFSDEKALISLTTGKVLPILKALLESTPVELSNDRMIITHWIEKLTTNKGISRMSFIKGIRAIFSEELYRELQSALSTCLQSDEQRAQLDLPMHKDARNTKLFEDNVHPKQKEENAVLKYRKFNMTLPDELKAAAQRIDARDRSKSNGNKSQGENNRKRGRGNSNGNNKNGGQQKANHNGQAQQGQKDGAGNGAKHDNHKSQGNRQNKKKKIDQARPPPPKVEAKDD